MTLRRGKRQGTGLICLLNKRRVCGLAVNSRPLFFLLIIVLGLISPHGTHASELTLALQGALQPGTLYVALYSGEKYSGERHSEETLALAEEKSKSAWKQEALKKAQFQLVSGEPVRIVIQDVDYGAIAIRAYIDTNQNAELDLNGVGYPREPFAYSRAPERSKPSKKFKNAVFRFDADMSVAELEFISVKNRANKN